MYNGMHPFLLRIKCCCIFITRVFFDHRLGQYLDAKDSLKNSEHNKDLLLKRNH